MEIKPKPMFYHKSTCLVGACFFIAGMAFAQAPAKAYVARFKDDKACAISYTFDDGLKEHYTWVSPLFNQLGFKGSFVINGSKINKDAQSVTDTTRMTWPELEEMAKAGHEVSNHGWAHKNHGRFSPEEIAEDIRMNDSAIVAHTGIMPRTFAYPNNTKTTEGMQLASANRVDTRTFQRSIGGKATDENLAAWVQQLIKDHDWGVGMTHGIHYGYDLFADPAIFRRHLEAVKSMEQNIWVGTFLEVAAYSKARDSIKLTVTESKRSLVIQPQLALDSSLFTEPLTMVLPGTAKKPVKQITQNGKPLQITVLADKTLFDFDPFGGAITIVYERKIG